MLWHGRIQQLGVEVEEVGMEEEPADAAVVVEGVKVGLLEAALEVADELYESASSFAAEVSVGTPSGRDGPDSEMTTAVVVVAENGVPSDLLP